MNVPNGPRLAATDAVGETPAEQWREVLDAGGAWGGAAGDHGDARAITGPPIAIDPGRLVVVAPHPDDEVLGLGATLAARAARSAPDPGLGRSLDRSADDPTAPGFGDAFASDVVVCVSDGAASHPGEVAEEEMRGRRKAECEAGAAAAGTTGAAGAGAGADSTAHVLVVGPGDHGVVRHGLELAEAAGAPVLHFADVAELDAALAADRAGTRKGTAQSTGPGSPALPGAIHIAFTDALFGGPAEAPARIRALARGRRAWLGLHDVPQEGEGEDRLRRRRACYAAICGAEVGATGVVVNSEHEKRCLAAAGAGVGPHVIPLPIPAIGTRADGADDPAGNAASGLPTGSTTPPAGAETRDRRTRVVGVFSDGHEHMVDELASRARDAEVGFRVTGHVADSDLPGALAAVDVPVTAHRHISASGSLNSWLGAGRRPIAVTGDYVAEVAARWPGHLRVVERGELADAIADALGNPASTWADAPVAWGWADVAAAHQEVWR